jgi:hypothetical protein
MNFKTNKTLLIAAVGLLGLGSTAANAGAICVGCERVDGVAGTYLGPHNAFTFDESSFNHTNVAGSPGIGFNAAFTDYFVFDIAVQDDLGLSVDYQPNSPILNFSGSLYRAGAATACAAWPGGTVVGVAPPCANVALGALLAGPGDDEDASITRFAFTLTGLAAGRYILAVSGTTPAAGAGGTYSGQLSTAPNLRLAEPGTLALLGLGLLGAGVLRRRRND